MAEQQTSAAPKYRTIRYRFWTYDVLGNSRDGYEVNDRRDHGTVDIRCKRETHNAGTEREFHSWAPTDRQLSRAVGGRGLSWDGAAAPDETQYAECARNGRPACELEFQGYVRADGSLSEKRPD